MKKSELRQIIREIIKESPLDRLIPARRPNDSEFELANKFAKEQGGSLDSIGVNRLNGDINIMVDDQGYILDKNGELKAEIVTTFDI